MKIFRYIRHADLKPTKPEEAQGALVVAKWIAESEDVTHQQTLDFMVDFDDCQEWVELAEEMLEDAHDEDTAQEVAQVKALQNWIVTNNCHVSVTV